MLEKGKLYIEIIPWLLNVYIISIDVNNNSKEGNL